jgi:hypothetical protein
MSTSPDSAATSTTENRISTAIEQDLAMAAMETRRGRGESTEKAEEKAREKAREKSKEPTEKVEMERAKVEANEAVAGRRKTLHRLYVAGGKRQHHRLTRHRDMYRARR